MRLVPVRRATMRPHAWLMDAIEVRAYRHTIETVMKIENLIQTSLQKRTAETPRAQRTLQTNHDGCMVKYACA